MGRAGRSSELGALAGSAAVQDQARWAEEQPPRLRTHDRFGHRVDEVEFHPAWHQLMTVAVEHGLHAAPWADDRAGSASGACREVLRLVAGRGRDTAARSR